MAHKLFQVGQKGFIEKDGKILVVFRFNGWFDFPGGRIEDGENDFTAALQREIREETSLEVEVGAPFTTWLGRGDRVYLVGYRCRYLSGDVFLSAEHVDHRWVDAETFGVLDDGSAPFEVLRRYFLG